jgi:hypothetical protein
MKVEFEEKSHCKNAEKGDLIEINGSFYLVVGNNEGDDLRLVNLDMDWIVFEPCATTDLFEKGNYKIIAKKGTFKIVRE